MGHRGRKAKVATCPPDWEGPNGTQETAGKHAWRLLVYPHILIAEVNKWATGEEKLKWLYVCNRGHY